MWSMSASCHRRLLGIAGWQGLDLCRPSCFLGTGQTHGLDTQLHRASSDRTMIPCEKGAVLAIDASSQPWVADYAKKGQSRIERIPIESAWF